MAVLGMRRTDGGLAEAYGVTCEFWQYADDPRAPAVELVAPAREDCAITDQLSAQGPGLYHLAFEVDDIVTESTRLRDHGFIPVNAKPCVGARPGMQVAFFYFGRPVGVLIELVRYEVRRR